MSSTMPPKNYHLAKVASAKRVEVPFTIVGNAALASVTATIDDELTNSAEIFIALVAGAGTDGTRGGFGGTAASLIDPSANDANSKAFPANLRSDGAAGSPIVIGFVIADGTPDLRPSTIPSQDTPQNPGFAGSTASIKGAARKLFHAEVLITDGPNAAANALGSGVQAYAARADVLTTGVTPNGNLKLKVRFPEYTPTGVGGTATLPALNPGAAAFVKGILSVTYL